MNILVGLDDTDNVESRGTGELASLLAAQLAQNGWGRASFVTRHQLLVHPDIPYTSHNSAMCFAATLEDDQMERFIDHAGLFLERQSAPGSDHGLCVALLERLKSPERLIAFGRSAKEHVLDKTMAYSLAQELGVHLSEHGGSGQGVVGALAGAGLRLGGNDGRLKGRPKIGAAGETFSVCTLLTHPLIEEIRTPDGTPPDGNELVSLDEKVKTVLLDGRSVLLLAAAEGKEPEVRWRTLSRRELKSY